MRLQKMKGSNDYSSTQHRSWSDLALNCCFVVFSALFLVVQYGVALADAPSSQECELRDHSSHLRFDSFIVSAHHSGHHPFGAETAPVDRGILESESENDSDDETSKLSHSLSGEITLNLHSGKSLFLQLKLSNESRSRIYLFILHHCWKSFLS